MSQVAGAGLVLRQLERTGCFEVEAGPLCFKGGVLFAGTMKDGVLDPDIH